MQSKGGFTYIETMVAVAIVALFFGALYALNTQCLYLLNSGRQAAAAGQSLQDRIEQFRSCTWEQLTDASYIQNNVLNASTTSGYNIVGSTEMVMLTGYPTATTPTTVVRTNGTANTISNNSNLVNDDMVRIDVSLTWVAGLGARARSQSLSSIIAKNVP
jgi:prepilin-type N-terminal cleavage/methylation domain-containing protein